MGRRRTHPKSWVGATDQGPQQARFVAELPRGGRRQRSSGGSPS
jgi:hypothetical protein